MAEVYWKQGHNSTKMIWWVKHDGFTYRVGIGAAATERARRLAAALNAEPAGRVEFVEFLTPTGSPVHLRPAGVTSVYVGTHGKAVVQLSANDYWEVKGTLAEVLSKLRGERGKGGADGEC